MSWDVKKAIKAGRAINDQTQEELAEALMRETNERWTRDMVASLETGKKRVVPETLVALSKVQNLDYTFYLNGPSELNVAKGGYLQSFIPAVA